jgi:polyhydroxyalkanoate synthesis repressor PhaR
MSLVYSGERIFILNSPRDIRLYPNRRLYDPVVARYIKYDDILALVRDGIPFTIKETARGKDQTHKVFTDLIIREELAGSGAEQAFTKGFLLELIRLGATQSAPLAAAFLNYSINTLMQAESEGTPRSKDR